MDGGTYFSSFSASSISTPRSDSDSTSQYDATTLSHLQPLPYIVEKELGVDQKNLNQRRYLLGEEDVVSVSDETTRSETKDQPAQQAFDSLDDIKNIITTANLNHTSIKLIEDQSLNELRSALQKKSDVSAYMPNLPVNKNTNINVHKEENIHTSSNALSEDSPTQKKQLQQIGGSIYVEGAFDSSGYRETDLSGSESESDESSESTESQFQIDKDLTSFEQQKACVAKLTSLSEQLVLNAEKLAKDSLQNDQTKQILKAVNSLRKELHQVANDSKNIKIDLGNPRDWNAEYQNVLEHPTIAVEQKLQKYQAIASLAQNFEYTAQLYGKIIITEVFLKNKFRTIRPFAEVGGNAGGEKFIYNGILFKFAVDWKGIYGSDHAAMKAAKHELLGLMAIHNANVKGVCTPLMCLIDYLGFRLIAISLLPDISKSTLIYGSDSAGLTVKASNPSFNKKMKKLGKKLNLAEHVAGRNVLETQKMCMPVDIEGHLSRDGRFYLLDTARLMPPTYPDDSIRGCYLIRLFRPEYVRRHNKSLSSDACSACFDAHDPNRDQHKADVKVATQALVKNLIPSIVVWREKHAEELEVSITDIIGYLHAFGVNLRYLPAVRRATASGSLKLQLLLEMTARGIKNHLLHLLREAKRTLGSMSEHSYRELIATACNKYLGDMNDQKTNETWDQLRARLRITFVDFPDDTELHNDLMEAPVKYQLAIEQGICPTIKWREPLIAPMQAWACKTCGIDEICGVCVKKCHKGHELGRCSISSGFVCACTIKCSHCNFAKKDVHYSKDLDGSLIHPLRYIITKMGMKKLFQRVSELTGIEFAKAGLRVIDKSRAFLTLSDVQGISVKIRKLPIVAIAEANHLALRAQLLDNIDERLSLLRQAILLSDSAAAIFPSKKNMRFTTELCREAAFIAPKEEATKYFFEVVKAYRVYGDKESALKMLEQIREKKLEVDPKIIDICLDLIMEPTNTSSLTRATLDILKYHGKHQHTLRLDGLPFVDDETLKFIATYSGCSTLQIGCCTKITDSGFCYMIKNIGRNLRELVIDGIKLTDISLSAIATECTSLINLSMVTCEGFTDKGIKALSKMPLLSRLNMKYCPNNPKFRIPSLQILLLAKTKITLKNLKSILRDCPALHTVVVSGCDGLDNVAEILPLLAKRAYSSLIAIDNVLFNLNDKIIKQLSPKQVIHWGQVRLISESLPDEFLQKLQDHNFTVLRNDMTIRIPSAKSAAANKYLDSTS